MFNKEEILESLRSYLRFLESEKAKGRYVLGKRAYEDEVKLTRDEIELWEKLE